MERSGPDKKTVDVRVRGKDGKTRELVLAYSKDYRYEKVHDTLNERARRLFAASEAIVYGYGGISAASRATGLGRRTIGKGVKELKEIEAGQQSDEMKSRIPDVG